MHLQLNSNACCWVAVIYYFLHCVTAWIWHPAPNKWQEIPHATHTGCYLSLKWGGTAKANMREYNQDLTEHVVYIFLLYVYFHFCLLNCEGKRAKQRKKTNIYCLWLHQAVFMCSQSVTRIVDIHLSLIAWLHTGGHLCKTVLSETKIALFVIYYTLQIDWFFV